MHPRQVSSARTVCRTSSCVGELVERHFVIKPKLAEGAKTRRIARVCAHDRSPAVVVVVVVGWL